jgi:hypothetical protein
LRKFPILTQRVKADLRCYLQELTPESKKELVYANRSRLSLTLLLLAKWVRGIAPLLGEGNVVGIIFAPLDLPPHELSKVFE